MKKFIAILAAAGGLAVLAGAAQAQSLGALTLYDNTDFTGQSVRIERTTTNLESLRFNDRARSIVSEGRWEVCLDSNHQGQCRTVQGRIPDLGEWNGSISSVRYLGPGDWGSFSNAPSGASSTQIASAASQPAPASAPIAQPEPEWHPMYNVDMPGNDYRNFAVNASDDWPICRAACENDSQCAAWTFVAPGRSPTGECWLKHSVPAMSESDCCISGIRGAPSSGMSRGGSAALPGQPGQDIQQATGPQGSNAAERAASVAAEEAERRVHNRIREAVGGIF